MEERTREVKLPHEPDHVGGKGVIQWHNGDVNQTMWVAKA